MARRAAAQVRASCFVDRHQNGKAKGSAGRFRVVWTQEFPVRFTFVKIQTENQRTVQAVGIEGDRELDVPTRILVV